VSIDATAIMAAAGSHVAASGHFDRVAGHEPKNAPGRGLSAAVWVDRIAPVPAGSGLSRTSALVVLNVRAYTNMLADPPDAIDPNLVAAVDALMTAYSGDYDLGGLVRNVDLLGAAGGDGMSAQAGYIQQDGKLFRVFTITLPLIISDVWEQVA
jgi:hypothetical protein